MSVSIKPLHPVFVGEVSGVDLRRPLTAQQVADLEAGMDKYAVLVFRDQDIDDQQQAAFSRSFGPLEEIITIGKKDAYRHGATISAGGNSDKEKGGIEDPNSRRIVFSLANRLWHSDSSFKVVPAAYSLLSARAIPSTGGNTEFADMRAAYDALDDEIKAEIEDLVCEHSLIYSRSIIGFDEYTPEEIERFVPVQQRLVRTHPVTGRKSLFLSAHAGKIVGMPLPQGRVLLYELTDHATKDRFVYQHKWRPHDLVMWDNRQTMHRAMRYRLNKEVRDLRRTTVVGDLPTISVAGGRLI